MKQTPHDRKIMERMAPGVLSRDGFLGNDTRSLDEIIATDRAGLRALGVNERDLADKMEAVFEKARGQLGRPIDINEKLKAVYRESMGRIPSPWPGEGVFQKGEVEVTDKESGESLRFTPLSIHLIREHGFFQGRGSSFRLEPDVLCRCLRLVG